MPVYERREPTPNPNAMKFHADAPLLEAGSLSFATSAEAVRLPLASSLFNLGTVEAVYLAEDYVSVSTNEWADWEEIEGVVRRGISMLDVREASRLARESAEAAEAEKANRPANDQLDKANAIIDRFVRPALAADGGGLQVLELDGHTLKVRYQGACGSCPSATMTTLKAIERLLRDQLDPELVVEAH